MHGFVESHDRSTSDLKLILDTPEQCAYTANADREGQPSDRFQKKENIMSYEVINIKTGKSVVRYESERTARMRYGGSQYKVVKSDQPANAFPVGFKVL